MRWSEGGTKQGRWRLGVLILGRMLLREVIVVDAAQRQRSRLVGRRGMRG